jgi:hypothetical protein
MYALGYCPISTPSLAAFLYSLLYEDGLYVFETSPSVVPFWIGLLLIMFHLYPLQRPIAVIGALHNVISKLF